MSLRYNKIFIYLVIYGVYLILFFTNSTYISSFSKKIEREIITPYKRRFYNNDIYTNQKSTPYEMMHFTNLFSPTPSAHPTVFSNNMPTPTPVIIYITPTPVNASISEEELWKALITYRKDHKKHDISRSENLCNYARKRAKDLYKRLSSHPDDPLDNHEGFKKDADSGELFTITGYNHVGENLAYTPGFTTATQVIEWGWDTSENHRNLQLSDDITAGCISGIHPIYVGIYAY